MTSSSQTTWVLLLKNLIVSFQHGSIYSENLAYRHSTVLQNKLYEYSDFK